jgi:hypothetical protein
MIEALRPSTLGEILDRTANIFRTRFLVFVGIAIMPAGVILACLAASVLFFIWVGTQGNAAGPALVGVASLIFLVLGGLIFVPICATATGLGSGALSHAAKAVFENRQITIRDAYRAAWKRGWRYIGLLVLEGLIIVVVPAVLWVGLVVVFAIRQVAGGRSTAQVGAGIGLLLVLVLAAMALYALWMLLMLCLSFPACVVEDVGAWEAVKRAAALSKGTRGRILVLYILGMLLRWGISLALTIPAILIVTLIPGIDTPQHAQAIGSVMAMVIYGGSFLVRGLTKPIYAIAQMAFYYDQRIRKEGFDIEWLMRQAGMVQAPPALPQAAPWMPPVHARDGVSLAPQTIVAGSSQANERAGMTVREGGLGEAAGAVQITREENTAPLQSVPGEPA